MNRQEIYVLRSAVCILLILLTGYASDAQTKAWTLSECINQALCENVQVNQQAANNEINEINYRQSKANVLPNLNLTDEHDLERGRFASPITGQYSTQSVSANTLNLLSSVTLFNDRRNMNLIRQSRLNVVAGNLDLQKMQDDLELNVIAAYMQVLYEYEALDIAKAIVATDSEHLDYTAKYVHAGSLPESNLLQVKAQMATDIAAVISAETQLMLARVTLLQLMEIPITDDFEVERPALSDVVPDISMTSEEIYNRAKDLLPDVKSAEVKTSASALGLKISRSELMPRLTLSGYLSTSYASNNSLVSYNTETKTENIGYLKDNSSAQVYGPVTTNTTTSSYYSFTRQFGDNFKPGISINLTVPIYNNRLYKSDVQRSQVALRVAKLNEQAVKNQLRKSVEQAYADQLAASKNLLSTKEQLLAEERSYHDMVIKFKAGTINATDFFVEKNNYSRAEYAHLSAKYDYLFKTKIVAFYTKLPLME